MSSTEALENRAEQVADEYPEQQLRIQFPDGDVYEVPLRIPAIERALHEARHNASYHGNTPEEEIEAQLDNMLTDNQHVAARWARKNMSWEELRPHAEKVDTIDAVKEAQYRDASFRTVTE